MTANLGNEYLTLEVYSHANGLGHGHRVVYWVGSDGRHSVVFSTIGVMHVVLNCELTFDKVLNVAEYDFNQGRIRYRNDEEVSWTDGGPIATDSVLDDDLSLSEIKQIATGEYLPGLSAGGSTKEDTVWVGDDDDDWV